MERLGQLGLVERLSGDTVVETVEERIKEQVEFLRRFFLKLFLRNEFFGEFVFLIKMVLYRICFLKNTFSEEMPLDKTLRLSGQN